MRFASRIVVVSMCGILAGCVTVGGSSRVTPDGGSRPSSTKISALGGGLIGGTIGQNLSRSDRLKALEAEYQALEYTQGGKTVAWAGGGAERGEVVAAQPYRVGSQDCRQYVHTLYGGSGSQTARGTACRNTDGSWSLLS